MYFRIAFDWEDLVNQKTQEDIGPPKKGDRHLLYEAPEGPFRQKVPVTFFRRYGRAFAQDLATLCRATIVMLTIDHVPMWVKRTNDVQSIHPLGALIGQIVQSSTRVSSRVKCVTAGAPGAEK